jgi:hypothetical protein
MSWLAGRCLTRQSWARTITIAASIVALFSFPLGTALGIYGLWVMFSGEGRRAFEGYHRPEAGPQPQDRRFQAASVIERSQTFGEVSDTPECRAGGARGGASDRLQRNG